MGWVRLDDSYPQHPKIVGLSDAALALEIRALCWSAHYGTDGFMSFTTAESCSRSRPRVRAIDELVNAGRWSRDDERGGYVIHDFLDYNPSSTAQKARREQAAERMRRARSAREVRANRQRTKGDVQANFARSSPNPQPLPPSQREGLGEGGGVSGGTSAGSSAARPADVPAGRGPTGPPPAETSAAIAALRAATGRPPAARPAAGEAGS